MNENLGFVIVIEYGGLEAMAALLVESIRRHSSLGGSPIYVVQPRRGQSPSQKTRAFLESQQAAFISSDLNRSWAQHGLMNKIYASALVERMVENRVDTLVFLDSDVLAAAAPDGLALTGEAVAGAAPIAEWRFSRVGQSVNEALNPFWQMVYEVCGVKELPQWQMVTTVDRQPIYPYFNSGVVASRPTAGVFRLWQENVERLSRDPRALRFPQGSREYYFLEQASLAGTLLSQFTEKQVRVLPHRFNYPLHLHNLMPEGARASALDDISFVHYHGHFTNLYWMDDIAISRPLKSWLLERLPLRPELRLSRGAAAVIASHLSSRLPIRQFLRPIVNRFPGLCQTVPRALPARQESI